ncbi:MAG: hypothetical protein U0L38_00380, partial [Bacteroidales bacterium]|nr:hypothetical protein [Bacteroidales bacterium]
MTKKKTKATYHCGRTTKAGKVYNANHNTNKKTRDGQNHIDHERTESNLLYRIENNKLIPCKSYDCIAFEKKRYSELFGESLNARNERYIKQRHKERCRSIDDLYRDSKKCPFEMILQIGRASDDMTFEEKVELSKKINIDFVREMYKRYGTNLVPLNLSGHLDEVSIHWHYRVTFIYKGVDGLEVNQTKAFEELGIERPDITKPVSKYNNPLMTFTEQARKLYYEICEQYGFEIDREVKNPSQKHKETLEHKCEMLEKEVVEKDQAIADMTSQLEAINREKNITQAKAKAEADRYKENKARADKEEIRALQNSELAEKMLTNKVKHNKDNTITIGLKQYQQATALVQETKNVLSSEVYSPIERKEMQLETERLKKAKARYEIAAERVESEIERRAEEKVKQQVHREQHRIERLEEELAKERHDKNYIVEMIKRFLPTKILERFEHFSGILFYDQERGR